MANPGVIPKFWNQPIRFIRYAMYTKPHYTVAIGLGVAAPIAGYFLTPLRRKYLYEDAPEIPYSYPIPNRPRDKSLAGYDD